MTTFNISNRI